MTAKAISFTPEVLKAKLRVLEEFGQAQTRRPCSRVPAPGWTPTEYIPGFWDFGGPAKDGPLRAPFGPAGQPLWVRERARVLEFAYGASGPMVRLAYEVDGVTSRWLPYPPRLRQPVVGLCVPNGVHLEGARHFLEVVEVRVERVAEISEHDAILEGIDPKSGEWVVTSFHALYDSIYGTGAHARDWCWVYTLKRHTP